MTTLKEEYRQALKLQENLGSLTIRQDTDEFQAKVDQVIVAFKKCDRLVSQLSLFSDNETMDDLSTNDVEYMDVLYRLGMSYERVMGQQSSEGKQRRREGLEKAAECYLSFLLLLDSYKILTNQMSRRLKDVTSNNKELKYLTSKDATTRRQDKIDQFKLEKALEEKLKLSTSLTDEDELRKIKFADLGLKAVKSFNSLESLNMELELLKSMPSEMEMHQVDDSRERQRDNNNDNNKEYRAGKLDKLPSDQGPLLDKHGKVNRPFTIVKSRDQINKQAFGTGQYLPTMTVDEYLQKEINQGGVLQGGEESGKKEEKVDEDDYKKADEETYKAREWDEFVEANPKGSGNTMNIG